MVPTSGSSECHLPQVPQHALPSPDTTPPISQSLQQGDQHPTVAGWLGSVLTSLANSRGTPHIARWVLAGFGRAAAMGAVMLRGHGERDLSVHLGTEGSATPLLPSCVGREVGG